MGILNSIISPMFNGTGYNPVNTLFIILVFYATLAILFKFLKNAGMPPEKWMVFIPGILLGVVLRLCHDWGLLNSVLFITPWIWILTAGFVILLYYIGGEMLTVIVPSLLLVAIIPFTPVMHISKSILLFGIPAVVSFVAGRAFRLIGWERISATAQTFDAFTTFIATSHGFFEEHVVARTAISAFGPAGIFIVKFFALLAAYALINTIDDENEKNIALFLVFLVGFAPGMRNMLLFSTS